MSLITRQFPNAFVPLFALLLVFQLASPVIERSALVTSALTAVLLALCVPAIQPVPRVRVAGIAGLVVVLITRLAAVRSGGQFVALEVAALLVTAAYVVFIAAAVFLAVIRRNRVTANTVVGAICVYLLMAHMFGLVYLALEVSWPGSITGVRSYVDASGQTDLPRHVFLYFSFMTLTTLGYGEMVPASHTAQSVVMLEAMFGQFFIAVFVARLVGSMGQTAAESNGARQE